MGAIHFSEMAKEMDRCDHSGSSDNTFSIKFLKCDTERGTGGELVYIERAQKCGLPYSCKDNEMRGLKNMESFRKTAVHLRLVFEFNGQTVYW